MNKDHWTRTQEQLDIETMNSGYIWSGSFDTSNLQEMIDDFGEYLQYLSVFGGP